MVSPGCCMVIVFVIVGVVVTIGVELLCGHRGFIVGGQQVVSVTCSCWNSSSSEELFEGSRF